MSLESLLNGTRISGIGAETSRSNVGISRQELASMLARAEESREVKDLYLGVINDTLFGKAMSQVMSAMGYHERTPDHYTVLDLPSHVGAATIKLKDASGKEVVVLAYNSKYMGSIRNNPLMRLYVALHEHGHVRGEHSESATDGLVKKASNSVRNFLASLYDRARAVENYASQRQLAQRGT